MGFLILVAIGLIVFAILKRQKNPKLSAFILLGLGLISLIIYFKFEGLVMQNSIDADTLRRISNATEEGIKNEQKSKEQMIKIGKPLILILTFLLFILGGYFLNKSNTKKVSH